jgi:hypothetical protein
MEYQYMPQKKGSPQSRLAARIMRKLINPYYLIPLLIILVVIFHKAITSLVLLVMMMALGALSVFYRRFVYFNLGFELVTFFTVVICFAFNPGVGIIAAIIMLVAAAFITGRICVHLLIRIVVYILLCLLTFALLGGSIATAGKIITIVMNVLFFFIYLFMYGFNPIDIFPIVANIFINFLLFSKFGELMLSVFV